MRPMMPPQRRARMVASGAMMSTVRAPARVRASTSRPRSSVPIQCAALGPFRTCIALTSVGLCVRYVEKSAMKTQKSTRTRPPLLIVLFWVFMALFSTYLTQSPTDVNAMHVLKGPSAAHWIGTDDLGRDVLARTLAGARTVLIIAPLATILALLWGGIIGLIAGFYRGLTDEIIMRFVDVLLALPVVITAILILSLLGKAVAIVILVIGLLFTPLVSRTVRSAVLGERTVRET